MKTQHAFLALALLVLLPACAPNLAPDATATAGGTALTETPQPTSTPVPTDTETPTITPTPTETLTRTPLPTRKPPYPVGFGTSLPDLGFQEISPDNVEKLKSVLNLQDQHVWQSTTSRDGKQLFTATSAGLVVYDRQGKQLAAWPSILLFTAPCESCLSVNNDGSRFALITRKAGKWELQVYNVLDGKQAALLYQKDFDAPFQGIANEARVALSPDGLLVGYGAGGSDTVVLDLSSLQPVLTYKGQADALIFSPDGSAFGLRRGRELLFWKVAAWKNPANLLLPAEDTPYAMSPDGKLIAVALFAKIRIYALDKLTPTREIAVPPSDAVTRTWQLVFIDEKTLRGYGVRWDSAHAKATVDSAEWDVLTGQALKLETSETDAPDALSALWGAAIPAGATQSEVEIGQYSRFRFVSSDKLLVSGVHSACWLTLSTGEKTCFNDPKSRVLASDSGAYREIPQDNSTLVQDWNSNTLFTVLGPYQVVAVDRAAKYILVNVNNFTVDLYTVGKKLPVESIAGKLRAYAENQANIVVMAQPGGNTSSITLVNKDSKETLYQKKDSFILQPLAIDGKGIVYFVQQDPDRPQVVLKAIDPKTRGVTDIARLSLSAEPVMMTMAGSGTFALGLQDGSVTVVSADGQQTATFQGAYSPVSGISFSPDGRYLAVAGNEGFRIFAVLP